MSRDFTLTPEQVRMARAALTWSTVELAREAEINPNTVTKFENGGNVTIDTLAKIKAAFERAGIMWVPENGGAAGVRPPRQNKPS
jgi:transcriptional regulator with XRE-family HTH domain